MRPDLHGKLRHYVERFNAGDEETVRQAVDNAGAYAFLSRQIPLLDCPDSDIERVYYFRWWTFRKHFKHTEHGHIITEFLPPVPWAGPYNSINCAACLHIREGRWLADADGWLKEYIRFWLDGHGDAFAYSSWLPWAVEEYNTIRGDEAFAAGCLDQLVEMHILWEQRALQPCGLFWSDDDRDGMEYSISGPGLRPTLNAYMYGSAMAIHRMASRAGRTELAETFCSKAKAIKALIQNMLWHVDFYKTIPCGRGADIPPNARPAIDAARDARELAGYIPWYYNMPDTGADKAFAWLADGQGGFLTPHGLTTAEQRHPRFMFSNPHECLWNGPIWPYATSQTLVALANALRSQRLNALTKDDYCRLLRLYALSHQRDGKPWIDENQHPYTGKWLAREQLEAWGWQPGKGGYERGKDYNHSLFCDLVLSGLLGIGTDDGGSLAVNPLIPDSWDYFLVTNITHREKRYTVLFDRTGERYGEGRGLRVMRESAGI